MTMNERYLLHKEKLEMFSASEIMTALNDFFSNPDWRDEKRFIIRSEFSIGLKRADMAADWAIDSAIRYLREEFGIFYAPDVVNKKDYYNKKDIKYTNNYISYLQSLVEQLNKDVKEKDEVARKQAKDDMDYILNAFREVLDALKIDKSEYVAMDIPSLTRFAIMEAEKAASNLDNYRDGAVKFAKDYSALQEEKEKLEKDLRHMTDWNSDLERTLIAARAKFADILEKLGVPRSNTIGLNMGTLQGNAIHRAILIKSEHDKYLKTIDAAKVINDARYERLSDLVIKISKMYSKAFNPEPGETCACTAERQLEALESYISELKTHNESLRKDINSWIAKCNDLRIRCNSVFGKDGFITKAKINDLCDEYDIVKPLDDEDCEASIRYILDILKEYRDKVVTLSHRIEHGEKEVNFLKDQVRSAFYDICKPDLTDCVYYTSQNMLNMIKGKVEELDIHNESLRKGHKEFRDDVKDLKAKLDEMSRNLALLNSCIKDLYRHVFDSTPVNMDEAEMLQRIQNAYDNAVDRGVGAGRFYSLICDYCDKYNIKKPSPDLTLEECIADIIKRFAATLKENQDFRYEVEKLYVSMTDQQPSYRMTMLGILRAIGEDVDDREEEYNKLLFKYDSAERLRKEWCRKYESEHERANGEHKKAEQYWSQIVAKDIRIGNLEKELNNAASNAVGYEALKSTLRKSLASEESLKKELDICKKQLREANDAIRKQNEAILRNERLDEPDDTSGQ